MLVFCAFKLITSNKCIAQSEPSFELVRRRKYSERAIAMPRRNNSLDLYNTLTKSAVCVCVEYRSFGNRYSSLTFTLCM